MASCNPHGGVPDMNLLSHAQPERQAQKQADEQAEEQAGLLARHPRLDRAASLLLRFGALFAMWVTLSGFLDPFHLLLGAACSAFVTFLSEDIFPSEARSFPRIRTVYRLLGYLLWLLWQVTKSNLWVFYLVIHPRMHEMVDPVLVRFRTTLHSRLALTLLANSVTLTPGTIIVTVNERGYFLVHAIDRKSASGVPGDMERKVAHVFGEKL